MEGERPDVDEAMARIERLWREGPTPQAFNLKQIYGLDGAPEAPPGRNSTVGTDSGTPASRPVRRSTE